jgi:hypothetical protein
MFFSTTPRSGPRSNVATRRQRSPPEGANGFAKSGQCCNWNCLILNKFSGKLLTHQPEARLLRRVRGDGGKRRRARAHDALLHAQHHVLSGLGDDTLTRLSRSPPASVRKPAGLLVRPDGLADMH